MSTEEEHEKNFDFQIETSYLPDRQIGTGTDFAG